MKEPGQTHTQGFFRERKKHVNRDSEANETLSENLDCLMFSMGVSKSFYMIFPGR